MSELNVTSESTNIVWHYFLYGGSLTDILINYTLLLICSLALLLPWQGCLRPRVLFSLLHTGLCISLQVGCWVLAEAYGISLVWCGQMGQLTIIILEMMWNKHFSREMYSKLICCLPGVAAIIYYYISFPLITTIAHLIALVVGALLATPILCLSDIHELKNCIKQS